MFGSNVIKKKVHVFLSPLVLKYIFMTYVSVSFKGMHMLNSIDLSIPDLKKRERPETCSFYKFDLVTNEIQVISNSSARHVSGVFFSGKPEVHLIISQAPYVNQ